MLCYITHQPHSTAISDIYVTTPVCYLSTRIANEWERKHSSAAHITTVAQNQTQTDKQRPLKKKKSTKKCLFKIPFLFKIHTFVWKSLISVFEILYE